MRMKTEDLAIKTVIEISLISEELESRSSIWKRIWNWNSQSPHKLNFDASTNYHTRQNQQ